VENGLRARLKHSVRGQSETAVGQKEFGGESFEVAFLVKVGRYTVCPLSLTRPILSLR
jgi:hypothetical protein